MEKHCIGKELRGKHPNKDQLIFLAQAKHTVYLSTVFISDFNVK
jgi:hypothetical protein